MAMPLRILLPFLLLACGGSGTSPDRFCESVTRVMCEGNMACCDLEERRHASIDECLSENRVYCEAFVEESGVPEVRFDEDETAVFEAQIRDSLSSCSGIEWGLEALRREPDAPTVGLASVLEPTLGSGEACGEGIPASACIEHCVLDPDGGGGGLAGLGGPGVCGPGLGEGETCWAGGVISTCIEGTYCDRSSGEVGVCAPLGDLGDPCSDVLSADCRRGTHCRDGQCVPNCTEGESCALGVCASGLVRDGDVCVRRPERSYCLLWEMFG